MEQWKWKTGGVPGGGRSKDQECGWENVGPRQILRLSWGGGLSSQQGVPKVMAKQEKEGQTVSYKEIGKRPGQWRKQGREAGGGGRASYLVPWREPTGVLSDLSF